jgi:thiamine-phosphate diphosphorylase
MALPRLHLVTDDAVLADPGFADAAEAVLQSLGPRCALHLRGHDTAAAVLCSLGVRLAAAALATGSWLLINDRVDIAMAVRANGVQLGGLSLPIPAVRLLIGARAPIGYSAHGTLEAVQAVTDGADFVIMGTIYASASHAGRPPAGIDALRECAARAGAPVLGIGGMTPARVREAVDAGAYGAAVLSGIWRAPDPQVAAAGFADAVGAAGAAAAEVNARQETGGA